MSSTLIHPEFVLTPAKSARKKRPSFSPVKHFKSTPKPCSLPDAQLKKPDVLEADSSDHIISTTELTFKEFSFWDDQSKTFENISPAHQKVFGEYMSTHYGVSTMDISGPILIFYCDNGAPKLEARPFIFPGNLGGGDDIEIRDDLAADLRPYRIPKVETLLAVGAEYFPTATHISYISTGVVVELPEEPADEYREKLEKLPTAFANATASLNFRNGPLATAELKRRKTPNPKLLDGDFDDVDYVKEEGCFYPGTKVTSTSGDSVSAGVLVQKDNQLRVTMAFHCWERESTDNLGNTEHFHAIQGNANNGTKIGYVADRVGTSDIALVQLLPTITFSNRFLEIDTTLKTLIRTTDIKFRDLFYVDSFVTGLQKLSCFGVRIRTEAGREKDFVRKTADLPGPGSYVAVVQGIYATSTPEISRKPQIREGVCGSALVRARKAYEKEDRLDKGEVGGFMHWSDLPSKSLEDQLLCLCDSVDELIDAGWSVVSSGEKRKAAED